MSERLRITPLEIPELLLIEPKVYGDSRGFFLESFNARDLEREAGVTGPFVQDNQSRSEKGVLRGLHYQLERPQGKLVQVLSGEIFDVAVDVRRAAPTFGRWVSIRLEAATHRQLWIPPGFAHGFLVLSESTDVLYKTTDYYAPETERCVRWDDPQLGIDWPLETPPLLSAKDRDGVPLAEAECFP